MANSSKTCSELQSEWGDGSISSIIERLEKDQQITAIDLSCKDITDEDVLQLSKSVANMRYLSDINLKCNQITSKGISGFAGNHHIKRLNLAGNSIDSEGIKCLIEQTSLRSLELNGNCFDDSALQGLEKNTTLNFLGLRGNKLTDQSAIYIGLNHSLTYVDLRGNYITNLGIKALTSNQHIKVLKLAYNNLSKDDAEILKIQSPIQRSNACRLEGRLKEKLPRLGAVPSLQLITSFFIKKHIHDYKDKLEKQSISIDLINHVNKKFSLGSR